MTNPAKGEVNHNYGKFKRFTGDRVGKCDRYPTSILRYSKPNLSKVLHPTQKSVKLLEYLVKTYTNEGETVLDNCMGSGSTIVACINTNRHYIGFELENKYFEVARERIEKAKTEKGG